MSNNLGRFELSVNMTGKEDAVNDSDAILDGAISNALTITWSGADATHTLTEAQLQQNFEFIMEGSTTDPTPTLVMADVQRGLIVVTNNLSVALTVEDFTSSVSLMVGSGVSAAIRVNPDSIGDVLESTSLADATADTMVYARQDAAWKDIGLKVIAKSGTSFTVAADEVFDTIVATNSLAITGTLPPNSSVSIPIGAYIHIEQGGTGIVTVAGGVGVTVNGADLSTSGINTRLTCLKTNTDAWTVYAGVRSTALASDVTANLTKGFTATAYNAGSKSSGTYTPLASDGNFQRAVNDGAHALAVPTVSPGNSCTMIIQYTNGASAGAIDVSAFTVSDVSLLTTTNGDDFFFNIVVCNGFSSLVVTPLQ
jgi:hypothetical protein